MIYRLSPSCYTTTTTTICLLSCAILTHHPPPPLSGQAILSCIGAALAVSDPHRELEKTFISQPCGDHGVGSQQHASPTGLLDELFAVATGGAGGMAGGMVASRAVRMEALKAVCGAQNYHELIPTKN